jgi:hydrogenase large subunit
MECGPLARMIIAGEYPVQASVIDRHRARAREAMLLADAMQEWLGELQTQGPSNADYERPMTASGVGLTEAPRGALGHWLKIQDGFIEHYQVVTPTCWNCSPKDHADVRGPLEEALVGTPVRNPDQPLEALRIIHSFDPCLDCATHVMRPGQTAKLQVRL